MMVIETLGNQGVFPSPFNSSTTISYTLPHPGWTTMDVLDLNGRLMKHLSEGWVEAGSYQAALNGQGLPSGELFIRLNGGGVQQVEKVNLVR